MRSALSYLAIFQFLLSASGCADVAKPGTRLLQPTPGPVTEASLKLRDLPQNYSSILQYSGASNTATVSQQSNFTGNISNITQVGASNAGYVQQR